MQCDVSISNTWSSLLDFLPNLALCRAVGLSCFSAVLSASPPVGLCADVWLKAYRWLGQRQGCGDLKNIVFKAFSSDKAGFDSQLEWKLHYAEIHAAVAPTIFFYVDHILIQGTRLTSVTYNAWCVLEIPQNCSTMWNGSWSKWLLNFCDYSRPTLILKCAP